MDEKIPPSLFQRFIDWQRRLPDKKRYAEFITAVLSIPVLITVMILNIVNLKQKEPTPPPSPTRIVEYIPITNTTNPPNTPIPSSSVIPPTSSDCKKEVGPVEISYPVEGATLNENPVTVVVSYHPGEYCAVVWSYRINSGTWSQFDDKSIALYNMTSGEKKLDLRVKSIASGQEVFLNRTFTYENSDSTPVSTESAMLIR